MCVASFVLKTGVGHQAVVLPPDAFSLFILSAA